VSEETEGQNTGAEAVAGGADPAAVALALGGASREEADAFLKKHGSLIDIQKHHLRVQLRQVHLSIWKEYLGVMLRVATAVVGLAVVSGIALMVWDASRSSGLLIEPFSVPPELAARGLTGDVVAARFLDKLQAMQAATGSDRPPSSFQNNWGSEIKVEIPETGLTFGELDKLLRDKFGHASHVSGEVFKTADGIAFTARLGNTPPQTFTGADAKIDDLAQQAAEAIYRDSQPYRFSQYLDQHGRIAEAFAVIAKLATDGPHDERGWAYAQLSLMDTNDRGDAAAARVHGLQALAQGGSAAVDAEIALVSEEEWSGHDQKSLLYSIDLDARSQVRAPEQTEAFFNENRLVATAWLENLSGDYDDAARHWRGVEKVAGFQDLQGVAGLEDMRILSPALAATTFALNHDPAAARAAIAANGQQDDNSLLTADAKDAFSALPHYWIAAEAGNWSAALADARAADTWLTANRTARPLMGMLLPVWIHPLEALALARQGDAAGAAALIGATPKDCYLCLRLRGEIAAQAGDGQAAERWFAAGAAQAPSLPFAYADWGVMLLGRGDAEGAIAKFKLANQKSPHFADPIEMWGEALIAKNQSHLALDKFKEADKYAPNWGRLHLKWGEALIYAGKADEAKVHFARAAQLDLTPTDKAELARQSPHT
jgi:tetratricopeptide (TPR) repeat protein